MKLKMMQVRASFLAAMTVLCLTVMGMSVSAWGESLKRIEYRNPGLKVDLGVGLWAWPLPVDYDGDGDMDLVVSCPDKPYNGTYFFENPGKKGDKTQKFPVFKPGVRLGAALKNAQLSFVDGQARVLMPGWEVTGFMKRALDERKKIYPKTNIYRNRVRANQWKYVDYDGDGVTDLVVGVGDWKDYGWDDAYNKEGKWTRGPLRGFVYVIRNQGSEAKPQYEQPQKVMMAGGEAVEVFGMPSPNFADFDGDGDLDLLCGEFLDGFTYFQNVGSRKKPSYAKGVKLSKGGKQLAMDLQMITPVAVDWDGDGDWDLISGDEDGRVALVEHTGEVKDGVPVFEHPVYFKQEAKDVKFGALVTPWSVDWDGDGDEDLICGNTAGYIGYFENLDGGNPPKWAAVKYLKADGEVIRPMAGYNGSIQGPAEAKWGYTTLSVADWNHDGLPDIMTNSIWGKVEWYENVGTRKQPKLKKAQAVEVAWEGKPTKPKWNWWNPEGNELSTQWRTTPVMHDWNKDGLNDLVMLDHEGYLSWYERVKRGGKLVLLPPKRIFKNEKGEPMRLNSGYAGKSGRRKLCIGDWTGDGRDDILVNSQNANLLRQLPGPKGEYRFKDEGMVDVRLLAGHTSSPAFVDWNKDGVKDLLIGAEDGYLYYLENPGPDANAEPLRPLKREAMEKHLVAHWDFEGEQALADKAGAGKSNDVLVLQPDTVVKGGVMQVKKGTRGGALVRSSADLALRGEMTLYLRFALDEHPMKYVSVVDKRMFRNPEQRSWGLYVHPDKKTDGRFGLGGQFSHNGLGSGAKADTSSDEPLEVGKWVNAAMVVSRGEDGQLVVRWWAWLHGKWTVVNGPLKTGFERLHVSNVPLALGNSVTMGKSEVGMRLDEVRVYNRDLEVGELTRIMVPRG